MKKFFSMLSFALIFVSCENDIKTNTPAFQGEKDNVLWKANEARVTVNNDGTITLNGYTDFEVVSVRVPNAVGKYDLGTTDGGVFASYSYTNSGSVYYYETIGQIGPTNKVSLIDSGSGYASLNGAIVQTTSGTGNGLQLKLTVLPNGKVTGAKITSKGIDYSPGDIITAVGGNNDATFEIVNTASSNGEVEIQKIENGTFTGTVKFNATDDDGNVLNFNKGVFYKVPVY